MKLSHFFLITTALTLPLFSASSADNNVSREQHLTDYLTLRTRVEELYSARKNNDSEALYRMMSKRFRELHSSEEVIRYIGITIGLLTYHIEAISIDGSNGLVFLSENLLPAAIPSPRLALNIRQRWVKIDGKWYHDPEEKPINLGSPCGGRRNLAESTPYLSSPCGGRRNLAESTPYVSSPCGARNEAQPNPEPCGR